MMCVGTIKYIFVGSFSNNSKRIQPSFDFVHILTWNFASFTTTIISIECNAINVKWLSDEVAISIRTLVPALFLVAGVFQFVGLGLVYNLDKKTLATMNAELEQRHMSEVSSSGESDVNVIKLRTLKIEQPVEIVQSVEKKDEK